MPTRLLQCPAPSQAGAWRAIASGASGALWYLRHSPTTCLIGSRSPLSLTVAAAPSPLQVRLGLPHAPLPDTPAKRRYATIEAARAVAFALTPGLPPIEHVTIRPRGSAMARILFVPQARRQGGKGRRLESLAR